MYHYIFHKGNSYQELLDSQNLERIVRNIPEIEDKEKKEKQWAEYSMFIQPDQLLDMLWEHPFQDSCFQDDWQFSKHSEKGRQKLAWEQPKKKLIREVFVYGGLYG